MEDVTVNGVRLAYRMAGEPQNPPLLLLHALGENSNSWDGIESALAERYRVYNVDLRGHGASDWPGEYSFALMRDDILGLLDALGIERATIVGHSLGGMVAYLFAEEHPDRVARLILEDPPAPVPANREFPAQPEGPATFDWAVVSGLFAQRNNPDPAWWERLTRITAPTLVIAGGPTSHIPQDKLAELAGRIPRGELVTIPAGHEIHVNRPAEFLAAYTDWAAPSGSVPADAAQ